MFKMNLNLYFKLFTFILSLTASQAHANKIYNIYLDSDFTGTKASSLSIEQGIETALSEINHKILDYQFKVIKKNHRGNSLRSKRNLESYLKNPNALLVFSGLHSPPILANKDFINQNRILLLDPWAAAGSITRSNTEENWIFRLSIDDQKAGYVISDNAFKEGLKKPFLLLEDTGWGRSNEKTMTRALAKKGLKPTGVKWFNWGLGINNAKLTLRDIALSDADVIFFVGNAPEGKTFAKAIFELNQSERLPIRSHWGITGGDFADIINKNIRKSLDLQFIQTSFSFNSSSLDDYSLGVFESAKAQYPQLSVPKDLKAQTGFIHAYDLTKLLIASIKQAGLTGDRNVDKLAIHQSLESLTSPVKGLIKTYKKPFTAYDKMNNNAHEALTFSDYVMAHYGIDNQVILIK
ncbi:ABC transporter substrate-binding protein [Pseudoalteromonas sp. C2R02]|uniref:ABC transporter substrate-binding protein n=1 Tax=Pseudoalteromonas sp. C2R02 TaxID=2841565 RepID=UPI001C0A4CD7|nr:ABC transporter substrate-binding protein [Pseudoalteromonas sp. C2R02]MBU2971386.1 ABC transporter substrate-binding protein [Pseudoalteromonas sp. C2R02]